MLVKEELSWPTSNLIISLLEFDEVPPASAEVLGQHFLVYLDHHEVQEWLNAKT